MKDTFATLNKNIVQRVTGLIASKRFAQSLAGISLACFGMVQMAPAQTTIVCDPGGDAIYNNGSKGGPAVPPWLDIIQAEVTLDAHDNLLFTLTMNAPIPAAPAWKGVDDGGQLWWGYRVVNDLATDPTIKNGCIKAQGGSIPEGYFVDLIWDVTTSTFQARLLDDTTCTQSAIPYFFSANQTQVTLVVARALLSNPELIPDTSKFQFLAATEIWKASSTGNTSFFTPDVAPNEVNGQLVAVTWSASSSASYFCP